MLALYMPTSSYQVRDTQSSPLALQIFRHQPPVTVVRLVLAAKEAATRYQGRVDVVLNLPFLHQGKEATLIILPRASLPIFVPHLLGRREQRQVDVIDPENFLQEIPQVIFFAETSELGNIIQSEGAWGDQAPPLFADRFRSPC
jgi:hypothetical protein